MPSDSILRPSCGPAFGCLYLAPTHQQLLDPSLITGHFKPVYRLPSHQRNGKGNISRSYFEISSLSNPVDIIWAMMTVRRITGKTRMWANAQRDGRSAEHRWRPLFNTAVWLTPTTRCRAVTLPRRETRWNLQGWLKLPDRSAVSGPKFTILWGHIGA